MPVDERTHTARRTARSHRPANTRLRPVVQAIALIGCGLASITVLPLPAVAQGAATEAAQPVFQIPAGPLAPALRSLASSANLLLSFTEEQTAGRTTQGVQGRHTPREALAVLLAGTGLEAVASPAGGYLLRGATGADERATVLPQIVVTAQAERSAVTEGTGSYTATTSSASGLNLSLRDTPQSVTVMTRQRMDDQALNDLGSVLAQVPGISFTQGGGYAGYSYVYSRGYRVSNYDVDGLPGAGALSTSGTGYYDISALDTAVYDSVTVVRGATGLLHGSGDPSGSVSLTRKRPTEDFQASISQTVGRWQQLRTVGDIAGSLNDSGSVRGRLVAAYNKGESWVDRYDGRKHIVYGVVEADLSDRTLVSLALENQRTRSRGDASGTGFPLLLLDDSLAPFSIADNSLANWSGYERDTTSASARLEHRLHEDWRVTVDFSHSFGEQRTKEGGLLDLSPDGSAYVALRRFHREQDTDAINAKINGNYDLFGRRHDLVAGFNGTSMRMDSPYNFTDWYGGYLPSWFGWRGDYQEPDWSSLPASHTNSRTRQHGFYAATRLHPTDALSVIVGGRLSSWKTRSTNLSTGVVTDEREEKDVFTPYMGVVYAFTDHLSAYASYTEIFNPQSYKDVNDNYLDPEKGKNTELGVKGEWFGGRLNATAAVFQVRKDNLAERIPDAWPPAYRAVDNTKGKGWEVEIAGEITPRWQLQAGYTRSVLRDSAGNVLNSEYHPRHHFKLFTHYAPAQVPGLAVGMGLTWQSEIFADYGNGLRDIQTQKSYTLAHLSAGYALNRNAHLSVNLNNVFDKRARVSAVTHEYVAPRSLSATLKYQF